MSGRIGVIGAMEEEVSTLIPALKDHAEQKIGIVVYHVGKLDGREVVIARSGIGKVNAALTAAEMIRTFGATAIVNTGVAGALEDSLNPEDAVIATDLVQHDYDTSPLGDEPGFVSGVRTVRFPVDPVISAAAVDAARSLGMRVLTGTIATGDLFVSSSEQKERIKRLLEETDPVKIFVRDHIVLDEQCDMTRNELWTKFNIIYDKNSRKWD